MGNIFHIFDTEHAEKYGVNCAIILYNIIFWLKKNKANDTNLHDDRYWTYNSIRAFNTIFDYLTPKQIRGALDYLREEGVLITGNYNTMNGDKTLWYSLSDEWCDKYDLFPHARTHAGRSLCP